MCYGGGWCSTCLVRRSCRRQSTLLCRITRKVRACQLAPADSSCAQRSSGFALKMRCAGDSARSTSVACAIHCWCSRHGVLAFPADHLVLSQASLESEVPTTYSQEVVAASSLEAEVVAASSVE